MIATLASIMTPRESEEFKKIVKEAIRSWLDEQFASFGRWTLYGLLAFLLASACTLAIWHMKP